MGVKSFGRTKEGKEAVLITLENKNHMSASFTNYGGTLVRLLVPGKDGALTDVVLGYTDVKYYEEYTDHFGAIVGRVGNRISGACYSLNGKSYQLVANNGRHNLHSGPNYYEKRFWDYELDEEDLSVSFMLLSPDMDQGYPGNAKITVTYALLDDNALKISYHAVSDKDTLFNMTNHSYFNLNGSGDIHEHIMTIYADSITQNDIGGCPDGKIKPVKGTPFDFNEPHAIGERINEDNIQLKMAGGYDHNYCLKDPGSLRKVARVFGPKTGIIMEVATDALGMQFYAGNSIKKMEAGCKGGATYERRSAFCLETQGYPNSINIPAFPSIVVHAGENYDTETIYSFQVE